MQISLSCIHCTHPVKDFDHILHCEHSLHKPSWCHKLYTALHTTCEKHITYSYLGYWHPPWQPWCMVLLHHPWQNPIILPSSTNLSMTKLPWDRTRSFKATCAKCQDWAHLQDQHLYQHSTATNNTLVSSGQCLSSPPYGENILKCGTYVTKLSMDLTWRPIFKWYAATSSW